MIIVKLNSLFKEMTFFPFEKKKIKVELLCLTTLVFFKVEKMQKGHLYQYCTILLGLVEYKVLTNIFGKGVFHNLHLETI